MPKTTYTEVSIILHTVNGDVCTSYPLNGKYTSAIDNQIESYINDQKHFTVAYN